MCKFLYIFVVNFSFSINLQNGSNTYQRSDIALHLSPVFSSPPRLVRNSLENQQWGPEESHGPYFPLVTGQSFDILILVESEEFKVKIKFVFLQNVFEVLYL